MDVQIHARDAARLTTRRAAFEHQRRHGNLPPVAFLAHQTIRWNASIVEERLTEPVLAGHLADGYRVHAGDRHGREEITQTRILVLAPGAGACQQNHVFRVGAETGPDLRTADHVFVSVPDGTRLHIAEIGPVIRLGKSLAPDVFGAQNSLDVTVLLLLGAHVEYKRTGPIEADRVDHERNPLA